jgi:hypothetical protein
MYYLIYYLFENIFTKNIKREHLIILKLTRRTKYNMNFDRIISNNLIDHLILSDFDKDKFKNVELCLGIDEAGRGPVLGRLK